MTGELLNWSLGGLFVSAFISSTLAPGGSELILAYLTNLGRSSHWILLGVATLGNTLGAMTTYGLGHAVARRYRLSPEGVTVNQRRLHLARRWGWPVLLLSWLPVIGDGFCFAAGWLRWPLWSSTLAIGVGKAARYAFIIWVTCQAINAHQLP